MWCAHLEGLRECDALEDQAEVLLGERGVGTDGLGGHEGSVGTRGRCLRSMLACRGVILSRKLRRAAPLPCQLVWRIYWARSALGAALSLSLFLYWP